MQNKGHAVCLLAKMILHQNTPYILIALQVLDINLKHS